MARKLAAFFLLFQVIGIFAESFNKSLPIDYIASETSVTMNDHTVVNHALYSALVIMLFFNLVGCLYILVRVFLKWRASESGILPMSDRLPGYTAITVVRLVNWELGRYDRRLFFIINILTIFTIIPRLNDGYGRLKYWYVKNRIT
ncbi:hypothetical protein G9A89_005297 [Geosiphon pyriformis]|nr:hypothetical protein G9A89_005297 [Geosiphon pyriformis]